MLQPNQSQDLRLNYSNQNQFFIEGVSKQYGNIMALDKVHINIRPGEFVFLTGPSGAGKSTLLKIISGDIKPCSGNILRMVDMSDIAEVFQDIKLIEDFSLEENLWLSFDKSKYQSKKEFYEDLKRLCDILSISNRLHVLAKKANGGLKQKVALVRALLSRPSVILADEPTSSLDRANANKFYEVLNFYNQKKKVTIIWASHNQEIVKQWNGRHIHLNNGKLIYSGNACFI